MTENEANLLDACYLLESRKSEADEITVAVLEKMANLHAAQQGYKDWLEAYEKLSNREES